MGQPLFPQNPEELINRILTTRGELECVTAVRHNRSRHELELWVSLTSASSVALNTITAAVHRLLLDSSHTIASNSPTSIGGSPSAISIHAKTLDGKDGGGESIDVTSPNTNQTSSFKPSTSMASLPIFAPVPPLASLPPPLPPPESLPPASSHVSSSHRPSHPSTSSPVIRIATFVIGGMSCASCASALESTLSRLTGVMSVSVALLTERCKVTYDPDLICVSELKEAIEDSGFEGTLAMGVE
eukprot:CAMPEP_0175045940 /NCGR_PEP_ID=MMETSP0052_2-20121109/4741_1 /TAXON_ID=51329 ORGANISM="Polytomella parva, Strain SAG 63-3" /NCGR_SAMPLE_ID=MMETSP0052_2 /ASSEMBLY_ACC=CAM_ASM_000194 /LENGTH=243 /DNA_ID=CAMNT_0016309605 /DNA_START=309 /DNA_END=1037 /DNA_ORIENTATION=+